MANTNTAPALTEAAEILLARVTRHTNPTFAHTTDDEESVYDLVEAGLIEANFSTIEGEPTEFHCRLPA